MTEAKNLAVAKDRLMSKISIDNITGCWNWTACKLEGGYGLAWDGKKSRLAHRLSYELHNEPIPKNLLVCHSCDNRGCVNPGHLFLGTQSQNIADMLSKRRKPLGTNCYNAKLTDEQVIAIRSASGVTQQKLADQYNVSRALISHIRNGRNRIRLTSDGAR